VKGQLQFVGIEHIDEIFERVCNKNTTQFGPFTFLMRAVMIRHSQKQQYRGTSTTLMSLPPKVKHLYVFVGHPLRYLKIISCFGLQRI
jgi:hypothetical protein